MSDTKTDNKSKTLGLSRPGRLELRKTVEGGQVRQSFSHGRSKAVQVEVKKKRTFKRGESGRMTEVKALAEAEAAKAVEPVVTEVAEAPPAKRLTDKEKEARLKALEALQREEEIAAENRATEEAEAEARRQREAEEAAKTKAEEEAKAKAEAEEAAKQAAAEAERQKAEKAAESQRASKSTEPKAKASPASTEETKKAKPGTPKRKGAGEGEAENKSDDARGKRKAEARRLSIGRKSGGERRRGGKMTVVQALSDEERQRSLASVRRAREREKRAQKSTGGGDAGKVVREVIIPEVITVQELAGRMAERGGEVVKVLMKNGLMATINQAIDADTAELVVSEFGHRSKRVSASDVEIGLTGPEDPAESLKPRAPVVTVMGHVDHGKTSLLDAMRATDVAAGEAGGITQHIGAYQVAMPSGAQITFLDTPGHAAFSQMRSRGANTTDIVILVVAADDGVMPQTAEAVQHALAAKVPIIVAINKMDRPDANPERVRNELLQHNIVVEEVGGDVLTVEVSAKERINLDKLEEAILLQSELLELKANPDRPAEGTVIESQRDRGRGVVTTVLVQRGTIKVGDILVAGSEWGRVRALVNDRGQTIKSAGPSQPVEVLGLSDTPMAGDPAVVVADESRAREVTDYRREQQKEKSAVASSRGSVEQMLSQIQAGETEELPLVLKADVHGSLEAIVASVEKMSNEEVAPRLLLTGVGGINESDIALAAASNAVVLGFNVRADGPARALARRDGVDIRYYSVIYELLEEVRGILSGMLAPTMKESRIGYARIKEVFGITKVGKVAGCEVTEGIVRRGAKVRLLRDNIVIHEGSLATLKRHKDEVKEVKEGLECGMAFENYQDIRQNDMIEVFEVEQVAREIPV